MTDLKVIEGGKSSVDETSRVFMAALVFSAGLTALADKRPALAKEAHAASEALQTLAAKLVTSEAK